MPPPPLMPLGGAVEVEGYGWQGGSGAGASAKAAWGWRRCRWGRRLVGAVEVDAGAAGAVGCRRSLPMESGCAEVRSRATVKTIRPFLACRGRWPPSYRVGSGLFGRYTMNETKETQGTRTEAEGKWVRVQLELDPATDARLTLKARRAGITKSAVVRRLLGDVVQGAAEDWPQGAVKTKTLVAVVRVPERVAQGMKRGKGSLRWLCGEWIGGGWEAEFDECEEWGRDVRARYGCEPEDREDFDGMDAGFVEAGSDAEKTIMALLTERAEGDTSAE